MTPIINIHYSAYLDDIYKVWIKADPRYTDWVSPPITEVKEKALLFSEIWKIKGGNILDGICSNSGLIFKRNYIPVYIVSGNTRTFSDPIVIRSGFLDEEFVNMVTHELIHCLFVDNAHSVFVRNVDKYDDHVVLYALMESVLPGTVDRELDTRNFPINSKYSSAMAHVRLKGYKDILLNCQK